MRSTLLASCLAALLLTVAAPAQAATGDSVPVLVPEVAFDGDSIWVGYNRCYVAVLGAPEPCTGPHRLAELPVGTDPCAFYGGILCDTPEPCDAAGSVPGLCGNPLPSLCEDVSDDVPGTCGKPLPKVPEVCRVGTLVDTCDDQCQVTASFDPCDGDCTFNTIEVCDPEPCDVNVNVPGTCGRPLPTLCEDVSDNLPLTCGNPGPDPCAPVGGVRPCEPDVWILVVDGELCVYRQQLGGGEQDLLFCIPV